MADYCLHCGSVKEDLTLNEQHSFGDFVLTRAGTLVVVDGRKAVIPPLCGKILKELMCGRLVTKERLLMQHSEDSMSNLVDVQVCTLRKALRAVGSMCRIETVWRVGLRLIPPTAAS